VESDLGWTQQAAQRFISVYTLSKTDTVADLEFVQLGALYELAAPSTDDRVGDRAMAEAKTGASIAAKEDSYPEADKAAYSHGSYQLRFCRPKDRGERRDQSASSG
jgi:hypothetical protein